MPKCPKCHKPIDYLRVRVTEEYTKTYAGNGGFDEVDQISCTFDDWSCPECLKTLDIADQEAADAFLAA